MRFLYLFFKLAKSAEKASAANKDITLSPEEVSAPSPAANSVYFHHLQSILGEIFKLGILVKYAAVSESALWPELAVSFETTMFEVAAVSEKAALTKCTHLSKVAILSEYAHRVEAATETESTTGVEITSVSESAAHFEYAR